jgi:ATP-binding cassette, subfamily B, heavy metal transporter
MSEKKITPVTFFKFFKPYTASVIAAFVFLIGTTIVGTMEPIFLGRIIDNLTNNEIASVVLTAVGLYFLMKALGVVFEFMRDYIWAPVIVGVSRDLEATVFEHLLKLPMDYHGDQKSGTAVRAVVRGALATSMILDFTISRILPPFIELILVTFVLFKLFSWQFAVITVVTILFYTWFIIWSNEKRIKYRVEGNKKDDQASGFLVDTMTNMETVKYFNNGRVLFDAWNNSKSEWKALITRNNRIFAASYATQGFIILFGLGLILYLSVQQAIAGIITVGGLVLVSTYIVRLSGPISILGFVYGQYKNSFADLTAMAEILNREVQIPEPENPVTLDNPVGKVEFDNVKFAYAGREQIINGLSFVVDPGQKVAFVGSSGAGKSTISKLIFRLFEVDSGEVKISDVNVKELSQDTRRQLLGIVPQEPALFNDTIANNIKFGKPNATDKEMIEAAKAAHIHEFIDTLPEKYNTVVGERGIKISGGQKQRVAIARAIIKNPQILIFDEATSSLDSKSEQAILKTLDEVAEGRTTIAIAHRLSTIVNSDVIYVLQKGTIAESGTHQELLKKGKVYAQMWKLQSEAHNEPGPSSDEDK